MRKILSVFVVVLALALTLSIFTLGASEPPLYVIDDADVLNDDEETALQARLDDLSKRAECHVIILTVEGIGDSDPWEYAKTYFRMNGYGWGEDDSGILLLLSMEERDWAVYTYGKAYDEFDGSALDTLENEMLPYFGENNYFAGFNAYADVVEDTLIYHFNFLFYLSIAAVIGIILAFITVSAMKSQLKSVRTGRTATDYVRSGSFNLTRSLDIYLYRNITRVRRSNESSSPSRGGSRSSGGGRSGKF
jgi:uncharacterized protein